MSRHRGEQTMRVAVRKSFYRIEMKQDVKHVVCIYVKCQSIKSMYKKKYGLVIHLLIPSEPWENVSVDFIIQLPKWNGMDTILVVVDQFSKLAKMVSIKMIVITFNLTKLFFDMWVRHHEMPQFIVSDRDAKFMMGFWKHLF
jgi:hypothetical protein